MAGRQWARAARPLTADERASSCPTTWTSSDSARAAQSRRGDPPFRALLRRGRRRLRARAARLPRRGGDVAGRPARPAPRAGRPRPRRGHREATRLLAGTGARVVAVEPVAQMRARLAGMLPDDEVREGTAEELPLADGSVDAVTVAQAFHWFDGDRALTEIHRVTRDGSRLAVLYNRRPREHPLQAALEAIVAPHRGDTPCTAAAAGRRRSPARGSGRPERNSNSSTSTASTGRASPRASPPQASSLDYLPIAATRCASRCGHCSRDTPSRSSCPTSASCFSGTG